MTAKKPPPFVTATLYNGANPPPGEPPGLCYMLSDGRVVTDPDWQREQRARAGAPVVTKGGRPHSEKRREIVETALALVAADYGLTPTEADVFEAVSAAAADLGHDVPGNRLPRSLRQRIVKDVIARLELSDSIAGL